MYNVICVLCLFNYWMDIVVAVLLSRYSDIRIVTSQGYSPSAPHWAETKVTCWLPSIGPSHYRSVYTCSGIPASDKWTKTRNDPPEMKPPGEYLLTIRRSRHMLPHFDPFRFFGSLENLYSFDPYIWAKIRKMYPNMICQNLAKCIVSTPFVAFRVNGRCWTTLSETQISQGPMSFNTFVDVQNALELTYLNSSPPSAAYMHQWMGSALVQITWTACRLFGINLIQCCLIGPLGTKF